MKVSERKWYEMPDTINVNGVELDKSFIDLDTGQWYNFALVDMDKSKIKYYCTNFDVAYL